MIKNSPGVVTELGESQTVQEFTPSARLVMQAKLSRGMEMIDCRTWCKWSTDQEWHPTRNGLFIEKKHFAKVIAKIANILALEDQSKQPDGI